MGEPVFYYYGFVLHYNNGVGHINSEISTIKKYMGKIYFKGSDLSEKFACQLPSRVWKMFFLVKYTLEPGSSHAQRIELVRSFEKKQFQGTLSVNGIGQVWFTPKGNADKILLMGTGDDGNDDIHPNKEELGAAQERQSSGKTDYMEKEEKLLLPGFPFDTNGLETVQAISNKGINTIEFLLPYSRMFAGNTPGDLQIGFVNYYVPARTTYIKKYFVNHYYQEGGAEPESCLFLTAEEQPDRSKVGRINTGKYLYFVTYRLSGEMAPNPVNEDEMLPKAVDMAFIAKVTQKRVVSLRLEEAGVRITLVLANNAGGGNMLKTSDLPTEPKPGQTVESFLNRYVTACLQEGNVQAGLDIVDRYRNQINEEQYHLIRFRLLPRQYKDTGSEESRILTIQTVDALLAFMGKTTFRLTLLLEKANKQLQGGEKQEAADTYQSWMNLYRQYVATNPEAARGLATAYAQVQQGLGYCEGSEQEKSSEVMHLDEATDSISGNDLELDDYILDAFERHNCEALGKGYERYNDLSGLSPEQAEELREFLGGLDIAEKKDSQWMWALAKLYNNLPDAPVEVIEEGKAVDLRDKCLRIVLQNEAEQCVRRAREDAAKNGERRSSGLFYCSLALSIYVDEREIAAALGTLCLNQEQFRAAQAGKMTIFDVLAVGKELRSLQNIAKGLVVLCHRNRMVKNLFLSYVEREGGADGNDVLQALTAVLASLAELEPRQAGSGSFSRVLEKAIEEFSGFYQGFSRLSNVEGRIEEVTVAYREFLLKKTNDKWMRDEAVGPEELRNVFRLLQDYGMLKGFPGKAAKLQKALEGVRKTSEKIQLYPTILSYSLYLQCLEDYNAKLLATYQKLCKTTKPLITLSSCEEQEFMGEELVITVPVVSGSNNAQDAKNVRLIIGESPDFTCGKQFLVTGNMPSDGRKIMVQIPLRLKDRKKKLISVPVRVQYQYISDVTIEEITRKRKDSRHRRRNRKSFRGQEVEREGYYPSENEWVNFDIAIGQQKKWIRLSEKRVNKFSDDGRINLTDVEVRKILKNRDEQIEEAVKILTMDNGQGRRVLNSMGRWVILYGQWRVGKSVILNCIEEKLNNGEDYPNAIVLKMSCTGSDKEDFESYFAVSIYNCLRQKMRKNLLFKDIFESVRDEWNIAQADPRISWDTLCNFMHSFVTDIQERDSNAAVVLLVDEFTEIYQAIIKGHAGERFPARWSEFINMTNVLCVTAGGEHTVSLMDTYAPNTLQKAEGKIYVQYLSKPDVEEYLHYVLGESEEGPLSPEDSYFSDSSDMAIERIFQLTKGNAYLLKSFCSWMIQYINAHKRPYLTETVVNETLDFIKEINGMDVSSLETTYFNSLYNPFNETREDRSADVNITRIEDDRVRDDNLKILHTIVDLADRDTHVCSYEELAGVLRKSMAEDAKGEEIFGKRYSTLINRKVIEEDNNGNVSIFIDLYYEIYLRKVKWETE